MPIQWYLSHIRRHPSHTGRVWIGRFTSILGPMDAVTSITIHKSNDDRLLLESAICFARSSSPIHCWIANECVLHEHKQ
jgi:hypothetical protein